MIIKKPIVAVDIDDVLADSAKDFIEFSNKIYGTKLTVDDYHEHWAELFNLNNEELKGLISNFYESDTMNKYQKKEEALPVLKKLRDKYELVVVTARKTMIRQDTIAWLNEHFNGIFSDVHFAGIWDELHEGSVNATKREVCEAIKADFLIDDQVKHCYGVAEAGIKTILFGDYSWNKDYKPHKNLVKLDTWTEVGDYLWNLDQK